MERVDCVVIRAGVIGREPMSHLPEAKAHHRILLSNCLAQAQALANGKKLAVAREMSFRGRETILLERESSSFGTLLVAHVIVKSFMLAFTIPRILSRQNSVLKAIACFMNLAAVIRWQLKLTANS